MGTFVRALDMNHNSGVAILLLETDKRLLICDVVLYFHSGTDYSGVVNKCVNTRSIIMMFSTNRLWILSTGRLRCVGRGVRNQMKMSDIGFLKIDSNWPQNSKTEKPSLWSSIFKKTNFGSLGVVFHVVSFTFHLPTVGPTLQQWKYCLHATSLQFYL